MGLTLLDRVTNNRRQYAKWAPKRKKQRRDLTFNEWLKEVSPKWHWDWQYLLYLQAKLEEVERGECKRLMLFFPPRHSKSESATVRFPVFCLERKPERRIIVGAYNTELAAKFSRRSRSIASQRLDMASDRKSAHDWETTAGGGIRAVGVGSGVTGTGADIIIIDDPVKSREEAESATYRERCFDWYTDDLYTRLEPGGAIILIMTRWHEDDLAGRILKSDDAPNWEVIRFPALAEDDDPLGRLPGQALCPERFDEAALDQIRSVQTEYSFQALYQQRPGAKEGTTFKRSWFRYFIDDGEFYHLIGEDGQRKVVAKSKCYLAQFVDVAGTIKQTSDYTVITTVAVTPDRDMLVINVTRERMETTEHETMILNEYRRWSPVYLGVESRTFGLNLFQRLVILGLPVVELKADTDKLSRSIPIQTRYQAHTVYHLLDAPWLDVTESELLGFPMGAHDDIVDTISYAGIYLARYAPLPESRPAPPPPDDTRVKGSIRKRLEYGTQPESPDEYTL